ncbi:PP2C family protein-serine/threonine phosphatase [Streptomyces daliensis]|uniref:Protein phosphatase 2C domain-containing protein n=1 Tax=Streptomyces daliensis TaxID=299421 RepID=A0A8T4J3Y8_9ACTN|nr:protein phosphatase 2C domain-containing protein [Streptomyces daliensis]
MPSPVAAPFQGPSSPVPPGPQGPQGPPSQGPAQGTAPEYGQAPPPVAPQQTTAPQNPATGHAPTPTEPDFTLPPAVPAPPQHGGTASAPVSVPAWHTAAPAPEAAPDAGAPDAGTEASADPRTADPRAMLDDSPPPASKIRSLIDLVDQGGGQGGNGGGARSWERPARAESAPLVPTPATPPPPPPVPAERQPELELEPEAESETAVPGPRCVACGTGTIDHDGYCEHCGHKQPCERDHMESELATVAAASDRGLRHHRNEDFYAVAETASEEGSPATIAVVCDGVSSATRSDEASAAAARAASASLREAVPQGTHPQQAMHDALLAAGDAVTALAADGPNEPNKNAPACTIVSALTADGILTVGWVGDSRAYWVPEDRTTSSSRLTEDDSWAAQMVAAGLMEEAEAYADSRAHAITGWLGADAYELEPHTASFKPDRPGVVVVCTDGLWNYAESADEMAAAVPPDARARPLHAAQHLVGYALDGGGHDNVTVAVLPFPALAGGAGSA